MSKENGGPNRFRVLKFGGTSVTGAERIAGIERIVRDRAGTSEPVVVVSAFAGVTSALLEAARAAVDGRWEPMLETLMVTHRRIAEEVLGPRAAGLAPRLDEHGDQLARLLHGAELLGDASPRTLDQVASFGERLSALIVAQALAARDIPAATCDARGLIITDDRFGEATVDLRATELSVRRHFDGARGLQVVTGFIAATPAGETTTLGRGGSDYTAALLGAALDAEAVEIWTDVPGVMSADPGSVPDAFVLRSLSYDELLELSHWGARVMHAPAVRPLRERGIPLHIRNSRDRSDPGTVVSATGGSQPNSPVRGIASVDRVHVVQIQGGALLPGPGLTTRVFDALARARSKVLLVSQASSERAICVALHPDSIAASLRELEAEFALELRAGALDPPVIEDGCSIIAVVGEGMRERIGLAGRLFSVLGTHGINVRAIAQGSSELNISIVIDAADEAAALRAVHAAYFAPRQRAAHLFLAGPGRVGSALLAQIARAPDPGRQLVVAGIARSGHVLIDDGGIDLAGWREALGPRPDPLESLVEAALDSPHHPRIFVDCTASDEPVAHYARLLRAGVAVVTPNKTAFAGGRAAYGELAAAQDPGARCYHETTVGAGLPVLGTLADLVATGDAIDAIEGVLSGTIGYILDHVMGGTAFSAAVRDAYERGYTEPDPRQDLSGGDVARKLLILGRKAGFDLEPDDVEVEPLVPEWGPLALDELWDRLAEIDDAIGRGRDDAHAAGQRLVYVGRVTPAGAAVRLETIGPRHPCFNLRGPENLVAITSARYDELPLVVRGPGAGAEVTAAGVYADILRACAEAADRPLALRGGRGPRGGRDAADGRSAPECRRPPNVTSSGSRT